MKFNTVKTRNALFGLLLIVSFCSVGLLLMDAIHAFIAPELHYPILWAVNVYRFIAVEIALVLGGVLIGTISIYLTAQIKRRKTKFSYCARCASYPCPFSNQLEHLATQGILTDLISCELYQMEK